MIHRIDNDDFFCEQHIVLPEKVHAFVEGKLDMGWYQLDVNLKKLSDPFDFVSLSIRRTRERTEKWRVDGNQWIPLIMDVDR